MPHRYDDWERRRRRSDMEGRSDRDRDYDRDDWMNYERGFEGRGRHERPENPYDYERSRRFGRREEEDWRRGRRRGESEWDRDQPRYEGNWGPGRSREREDWETYGRPEDFGGETGFQGGYRRDWEDQDRYGYRNRQMDWERNREMMDRSQGWERPGPEQDRQMRGSRDWNREQRMRGGRDWDRGYYWDEEQDPDRGRWQERQRDIGHEEDFDIYDYEDPYDWSYSEVWTIEGPFTGIGPQGYQRSDDRIFEEVCERLTQHGKIDATDMEVEVDNGEVYLKGKVENRQTKRLAEDTVATVPGVMDVHNQLKVTQPRREQTGRRQQMEGQSKTKIRERIYDRMKVLGRDKQEIGEVKEIRDNDFLVDRPLARDVYVPFDACYDVSNDRILLNIRADEVNDQNWPVPEIIETDRGGE
jgi:hypothetical protein